MPTADSPTPSDSHPRTPFALPPELADILAVCPGYTIARNVADLLELSVSEAVQGWHTVAYDIPDRGRIPEARVCRTRNGLAANYLEPYMRSPDPDCIVIGDDRPTDKPTYHSRFGTDFESTRAETFAWLKTQRLIVFPFIAGIPGQGIHAVVAVPANAGFFAVAVALLQGILAPEEIPAGFSPGAAIYVAPPFRHTHFAGRQLVVHNRRDRLHELFSYNLYPGPSAKKGIYGMLLNVGEEENWTTIHCSTVQVTTPYHNRVVIAHEGPSGGGKSQMLEQIHRQPDGSLLLGRNLQTGEERLHTLGRACDLRPVTDDMALCHPSLEKGRGKLTVLDAENAWFICVDHIRRYGADPRLEALTIRPEEPLLFLNLDAQPGSTALIWDHIEDAPGVPCPNPRVVVPRRLIPGIVPGAVDVDIRSFGVRTPPCSRELPSYGIIGLFHVLPPALAWLWRLVAPSGRVRPGDPGSADGIASEGVGSYWPFATGRRVDHANILLNQILERPEVRYILVPNQHIGVWAVGHMPQWIAREYLARRGHARFTADQIKPSRCTLLGYTPRNIVIEGRTMDPWIFEVDRQSEVGPEAYDRGAAILSAFFKRELAAFLHPELLPLGRRIIDACLRDATLDELTRLIDHETIASED